MKSESRSLDRIGFGTIAALLLAPIIITILRYPIVSAIGGDADAYHIIFASLILAIGTGLVSFFLYDKNSLIRLGAICAMGILLSLVFGTGFRSQLSIATMLFILGILLSLLITWLSNELPAEFDGLAKQYKFRSLLFILLVTFSVFQTSRLSVFMNNAEYKEVSMMPSIPFLVTHSCLTAYVHAIKLLEEKKENLYDPMNWPHGSIPESYAPFPLDAYMYPPPFLLLPATILGMTNSFQIQRAIWFGFCGLLIAFAFWTVAKWTSRKDEWHSMFLTFLVWSSLAVLITFQVGNIHHVTMALAILGMLAFEHKHPMVGGALLAFAIISKISPGLLGVVLLVQGRWRDAAWTFAFGIFFTTISLLLFGIKPMQDFILYQLPLLNSGQAMYWLDKSPSDILINSGPFSIPFKLGLLGLKFENPWRLGKTISTIYTILVLVATVFFSLQEKDRRQKACFWLGILTLASLQSPFAPGYTLITLSWALTLVAAEINNNKRLFLFIFGWIVINGFLPVPPVEPTIAVIYSLFQLPIYMVAFWILFSYKPNTSPALPILQ